MEVTTMAERFLADLKFASLIDSRNPKGFHPSPMAWEDQVIYFLLLDRFSDGQEQGYQDNQGALVTSGTTALFQPDDKRNAIGTDNDAKLWREAGNQFVGGKLKGLSSKIGYLKRMGISAIWVSPVFKQVKSKNTFHGYAIQNFLDVDPQFGSREDLREMVDLAHQHGIYVILDIVLNHSGDVFEYDADRYEKNENGKSFMDPRWDRGTYKVRGFRDNDGNPTLPFRSDVPLTAHPDAWPHGAIWPAELQRPETFTRKGNISNMDYDPEFLEGDFFGLKDIHHGQNSADGHNYQPSAALNALAKIYKFWIAYADIDGFRIDTVKHMDPGATRFFTAVIKDFTQSIGKENFYLIGEITGGPDMVFGRMERTGLDAALGIDDIPQKLEGLVKGSSNPQEYFGLFRNSLDINKESHTWFRNKVVTMFNDHDMVRQGKEHKARFCAGENDEAADRNPKLLPNALALNVTTIGIPCIYYGSEQCFDGQGGPGLFNDRYIREAMFGGVFGAFRSRGRHFFDETNPAYRRLAEILAIRRQKLALRRGRQYLREISGDGEHFGYPTMVGGQIHSVVPWSRLFNDQELLLAINTDADDPRTAWVTIDNDLHQDGETLRCIYSSAPNVSRATVVVETHDNRKVVELIVPAAGFVIYE